MNVGTLYAALSLDSKGFEKALDNVGIRLGKFSKVAALGLAALAVGVAGAFAASASAAIDFEDAFAGVRKTVEATEEQYAAMSGEIRQMATEMPLAATEIAGVAEAAGQLGIKREAIIGFSEVMSKLGVTTNMSADEAATGLARLANITQMPQDAFDRLGSTIVALGNAGASTESEIVEMGLRIAGAGSQVGMTEAQILAFANALSSVGIEAAAGGSAISRVMIDMATSVTTGNEKLADFAAVAGMSASQFQQAFKEDAAGAIITFTEGLGRISDSGGDVFTTLDRLGLSEVRVRDALLRAAGAGDLFRESIEMGNIAWEENTALNVEAEKRFATTASKIQVMWNRVTELAIVIGTALLPVIGAVAEGIGNFAMALTKVGELIDFLKPGLIAVGTIIGLIMLPAIVAFAGAAVVAAAGVVIAFAPVIAAFAAVSLAVVGVSAAVNHFAMDFGDMGDRIHDIADQSKEDFTEVKDWIRARMEETGESFEQAADAADKHFGAMSQSSEQLVAKSATQWETYQAQISGAGESTSAGAAAITATFDGLEEDTEESMGGVTAAVGTMASRTLEIIQGIEEPARNAGQAAFAAVTEVMETEAEIQALKAEQSSKEMRENLASSDPDIVADAEARNLEITQKLIELENIQAFHGDNASKIAKQKSLLASQFMLDGLESEDPEIRATFRVWKEELEKSVRTMESSARNARIGQDLAANLRSHIPGIREAAEEAARAVRATFPQSEPKNPNSPFRGITKGWGLGKQLEKGVRASLVGVDLAGPVNARLSLAIPEPRVAAADQKIEMMRADESRQAASMRDNESDGNVTVQMTVQPREVVDAYDIGLEARRAVTLGMKKRRRA